MVETARAEVLSLYKGYRKHYRGYAKKYGDIRSQKRASRLHLLIYSADTTLIMIATLSFNFYLMTGLFNGVNGSGFVHIVITASSFLVSMTGFALAQLFGKPVIASSLVFVLLAFNSFYYPFAIWHQKGGFREALAFHPIVIMMHTGFNFLALNTLVIINLIFTVIGYFTSKNNMVQLTNYVAEARRIGAALSTINSCEATPRNNSSVRRILLTMYALSLSGSKPEVPPYRVEVAASSLPKPFLISSNFNPLLIPQSKVNNISLLLDGEPLLVTGNPLAEAAAIIQHSDCSSRNSSPLARLLDTKDYIKIIGLSTAGDLILLCMFPVYGYMIYHEVFILAFIVLQSRK